jgi:hypothetical protein
VAPWVTSRRAPGGAAVTARRGSCPCRRRGGSTRPRSPRRRIARSAGSTCWTRWPGTSRRSIPCHATATVRVGPDLLDPVVGDLVRHRHQRPGAARAATSRAAPPAGPGRRRPSRSDAALGRLDVVEDRALGQVDREQVHAGLAKGIELAAPSPRAGRRRRRLRCATRVVPSSARRTSRRRRAASREGRRGDVAARRADVDDLDRAVTTPSFGVAAGPGRILDDPTRTTWSRRVLLRAT